MSRSTGPPRELEERVRAALHARASATVTASPDRFVPRPPRQPRVRRHAKVALAAAALALAAALVASLAFGREGRPDVATDPAGPDGTRPSTTVVTSGQGDARARQLSGPSGSRWFVLDLPGVVPAGASRTEASALDDDTTTLQSFRTDAGFSGPLVWVETVPLGAEFGFGDVAGGATQVTVGGSAGYLYDHGDAATLGVPDAGGAGLYVNALGLPAADVVEFAAGLRLAPGGEGVDAEPDLPRGLEEVLVDTAPPADPEYAEWSYTGENGENYELFVTPGGGAVFEDGLRQHVEGGGVTLEAMSVDSRPGVIVHRAGESVVLWRPTDDVVVDFRTSAAGDDLIAAVEALRPVDLDAWVDHLPPEIRPEPPAAAER